MTAALNGIDARTHVTISLHTLSTPSKIVMTRLPTFTHTTINIQQATLKHIQISCNVKCNKTLHISQSETISKI